MPRAHTRREFCTVCFVASESLVPLHCQRVQLCFVVGCRQPILTGTSVLAVKYADGVMMSSDTLASYGGLARFSNIVRLHPVGDNTLIGCTGDLSDFDQVKRHLHDLIVEDFCADDGTE